MTNFYPCDGETLFGFTVKKCDKPCTHLRVRNGDHEFYDFCDEHYFFFLHGHYPGGAPGVDLFGNGDTQPLKPIKGSENTH